MKLTNFYTDLSGTKIDHNRSRTWRWPTVTLHVPEHELCEFLPVATPERGDLALTEVLSVGAPKEIEDQYGCNMSIFPGTVILTAFAPRYAPDEFEGEVPLNLEAGQEIDLLNRGGTIGNVVSKNSRCPHPTTLRVLGFIKDSAGRRANIKYYSRALTTAPLTTSNEDRTMVVVTGTSMNSGKSSTAKAIIHALTASGHRVVAGKVTGQAARKDIILMNAAGAVEVVDFVDFGYPSTSLLEESEVISIFWSIYNHLYELAGPGGYIVIEIADGIYQRETAMILSNAEISTRIDHLIFSCSESLSAVAGTETLKSHFGLEATAISGPAANSPLGLKEIRQFIGDFPAFDNMVMDVPLIAGLLKKRNRA